MSEQNFKESVQAYGVKKAMNYVAADWLWECSQGEGCEGCKDASRQEHTTKAS